MRKPRRQTKTDPRKRLAFAAAGLRLLVTAAGVCCAVASKAPFFAPVAVLVSYLIPVGSYRILRVQAVALAAVGAYAYTAVSHGNAGVFFIVSAGLCLGALAQR